MNRKFTIVGLVLILFGSFLVMPSMAMSYEKDTESLEVRFLLVIGGRINVNFNEKELNGFGLIVYTSGELNYFQDFSINYKFLPMLVKSGFIISHCFYIPA